MTIFHLNLAGQEWDVDVPDTEIESIHKPLLKEMSSLARGREGRFIVLLAAPPGGGKTTTAALWENLSKENDTFVPTQALPMDGFHFPNGVLDKEIAIVDGEKVPLRRIKGAPESYDLGKISGKLEALRAGRPVMWPYYDRKLHDPVPDAIVVTESGIIVIEGNYLLLDEPGWRELKSMADFTVFIESDVDTVRKGMIERAVRGGRTRESALEHFDFNDRRNIERVLGNRLPADHKIAAKKHI